MAWQLILAIGSWIFWLIYGFVIGTLLRQAKNDRENAEKLNNVFQLGVNRNNDRKYNDESKDSDINYLNEMIEILRKMLKKGVSKKSIAVGDSEYIIINCELDCLVKKRDELKQTCKRSNPNLNPNLNVNRIYKQKRLRTYPAFTIYKNTDHLPNKKVK